MSATTPYPIAIQYAACVRDEAETTGEERDRGNDRGLQERPLPARDPAAGSRARTLALLSRRQASACA